MATGLKTLASTEKGEEDDYRAEDTKKGEEDDYRTEDTKKGEEMATGLKTPKRTRNGKKNEDVREKEKRSIIFSFFFVVVWGIAFPWLKKEEEKNSERMLRLVPSDT